MDPTDKVFPTLLQANEVDRKSLTRRKVLNRFKHLTLGTSTAYLAMAVNYQKPSFKKLFNMSDAAAQTTSSGNGSEFPP